MSLGAGLLSGLYLNLLAGTPRPTPSQGMTQLNGIYTQVFNRCHDRVGHLFQGRYEAILVERESYLLELIRYVVRNPVRAKMVRSVGAWLWSSYRATAGEGPSPAWLEMDWVLSQFGRRRAEARRGYREFVAVRRNHPFGPWNVLRGEISFGSDGSFRDASEDAESWTDDPEIPPTQREGEPLLFQPLSPTEEGPGAGSPGQRAETQCGSHRQRDRFAARGERLTGVDDVSTG